MKGIFFNEAGDPLSVLRIGDFPVPEPAEGEVRIKVAACPINPADFMFIQGKYRVQPHFPQIAGLEGAGYVEKLGKNSKIPVGSLVSFRTKGTWTEYITISEKNIFQLPTNLSIEKAAQFSLNPVTAWALIEKSKLEKGEWIILTAGNSSVSRLLTQIAKHKGINTISLVRAKEEQSGLKKIGATEVIDYPEENIPERVNQITNGLGAKCVLDSVGGTLGTTLIKCLTQNGLMLVYGLLSKDQVEFHNSSIIFKNITISGFGIDGWLNSANDGTKQMMLEELISMISEPEFEMAVHAKYPLLDAIQAVNFARNSHSSGKVLIINEPQ